MLFSGSNTIFIFNRMEIELPKQFVLQIHPMPDAEIERFTANWQPLTVKRKTVLTAAGETERYIYFVLEGLQRVFYVGDGNKEATIVFTYPPSFRGIADSFLTQTPSLYFLETLTASHFLRISYDEIGQLMKTAPITQEFLFKATALALKGALYRHVELQCFTNEEKFRTLLQGSPHILNLVPHKYLSSYLGMDATNFRKLLGSIKFKLSSCQNLCYYQEPFSRSV